MSHLLYFKTTLELKRYSSNTIESYMSSLKNFAREYDYTTIQLEKLEEKDIIISSINIIKKRNYSISSQKQLIGALFLSLMKFQKKIQRLLI